MTARIELGPLVLHGDNASPYRLHVQAEGLDFGAPQSSISLVQSLLADGSALTRDRDNNRTVTVNLWIVADDGQALAAAEQDLAAQLRCRNTLVWTPIQEFAPPTVFDVVDSDMQFIHDDIFEHHGWRQYALTITAHPFARSQNPVKVAAIAPATPGSTPVYTLIDNGSSTTGWTSSDSLRTISGTVESYKTPPTRSDGGTWSVTRWLERTFATAQAVGPFIRVKAYAGLDQLMWATLTVDGVPAPLVSVIDGDRVFQSPSATAKKLRVTGRVRTTSGTSTQPLRVDDMSSIDRMPVYGSTHQSTRYATIRGSARTEGSIFLSAAVALGDMLVYTCNAANEGYMPALRRFQTSGQNIAQSTRLSGAYGDLAVAGGFVADIPIAYLTQGNRHNVVAYFSTPVAADTTLTYQINTIRPAGLLGPTYTGTMPLKAGTFGFVSVALEQLPPLRVDPSSASTCRITLSTAAAAVMDEAWVFDVDAGALTVVQQAGGHCMWLDAPSVDSPTPQIWIGDTPDRAESYAAPGDQILTTGQHVWEPGPTMVYTAASSPSEAPAVSLCYYPRWLMHAAS